MLVVVVIVDISSFKFLSATHQRHCVCDDLWFWCGPHLDVIFLKYVQCFKKHLVSNIQMSKAISAVVNKMFVEYGLVYFNFLVNVVNVAGRNLQSSNSPPEEHFFSTRMPSCPAALVHYGRFFFVDNSDNSFYHALGLLSSATSCKSPQCNHHAYCFGDFNTPLEKLHFIDPIFLGLGFVWVC